MRGGRNEERSDGSPTRPSADETSILFFSLHFDRNLPCTYSKNQYFLSLRSPRFPPLLFTTSISNPPSSSGSPPSLICHHEGLCRSPSSSIVNLSTPFLLHTLLHLQPQEALLRATGCVLRTRPLPFVKFCATLVQHVDQVRAAGFVVVIFPQACLDRALDKHIRADLYLLVFARIWKRIFRDL